MATIIEGKELIKNDNVKKMLKEHIKKNNLIGFPTETVYGLGGNSLSEISLKNIFKMKNRPISDPIISHVYDIAQAFDQLYHINMYEKYIIYILNMKFSPGPLSIIAKAKEHLPLILTAHTQFCAVRIPNNKIAKEIIKICDTPIAAPSANKFQHISPTNSLHVYEEFKDENILIFDDGQCDIGIESTVIKIIKYKKEKEKNINSSNHNENGNENFDEYASDDEIIIDEEYEKECNSEISNLKCTLNCKNDVSNFEVFEKLKEVFEMIKANNILNELDENMKNKITEKILKYKNLYNYEIKIYRRGKYTKNDLKVVLNNTPLLNNIRVTIYKKIEFEKLNILKNKTDNEYNNSIGSKEMDIVGNDFPNNNDAKIIEKNNNVNLSNNIDNNDISMKSEVSPGTLLTHYSPVVSTYLIDIIKNKDEKSNKYSSKLLNINLNKCIFLDIGNSFFEYENNFLKYLNISYDNLEVNEQIKYVTKNFFLFLRKAENLAINHQAKYIFISIVNLKPLNELTLSIFDRIFRSASGKIFKVFVNQDKQLEFFNN
ncbi:threonylcarbamoyl-AMP synthase, putative [Plasmodium berghei]|uniref:Threonylcarbamoyl-AMP synthase n=2 Tax=Plasmodium berghei TaxID=5821 RepID=A0A509AIV4_PLABA|nr:threonylcarbamoyl-AMP synthase, putative [Plasmodium berghei ANKA]CXI15394.1 threonylcarbamoyl-AMP synthase, putative [Plasmodium berghei]SCM19558.1 threonylcarbamoyl-AMP synthase, putative [Plasmodium berghei]SCN23309.1 threonylcarbamoyl-AMP synthase, putative [Plasmodium berghei]SCO59014.1 threonylcarbamoyl-AMP synthase, putative [Plasmodium berghei]SCO59545.1 threonylcarbamoyl-AMP synthase, putative [Plasmodium berghei]|eukprot:XP_034420525.1 threonylcarbamoyl-AMP synthase, putative [Plasmodium berghei ANKA]